MANRLFLNRGGGKPFEDVSEKTLVFLTRRGTGTIFLDYDNAGDHYIFMAAVGEQMFLQNKLRPEGRLEFVDV